MTVLLTENELRSPSTLAHSGLNSSSTPTPNLRSQPPGHAGFGGLGQNLLTKVQKNRLGATLQKSEQWARGGLSSPRAPGIHPQSEGLEFGLNDPISSKTG